MNKGFGVTNYTEFFEELLAQLKSIKHVTQYPTEKGECFKISNEVNIYVYRNAKGVVTSMYLKYDGFDCKYV